MAEQEREQEQQKQEQHDHTQIEDWAKEQQRRQEHERTGEIPAKPPDLSTFLLESTVGMSVSRPLLEEPTLTTHKFSGYLDNLTGDVYNAR